VKHHRTRACLRLMRVCVCVIYIHIYIRARERSIGLFEYPPYYNRSRRLENESYVWQQYSIWPAGVARSPTPVGCAPLEKPADTASSSSLYYCINSADEVGIQYYSAAVTAVGYHGPSTARPVRLYNYIV